MGIVRPERHPLTGDFGLAQSIYALRTSLGLKEPGLGTIKAGVGDPGGCGAGWSKRSTRRWTALLTVVGQRRRR